LRAKIGLDSVFYAANHGLQIAGPPGSGVVLEVGSEHGEELAAAAAELKRRLLEVKGAAVEAKGLSVSVHYRLVAARERPQVERIVTKVLAEFPALRLSRGKMVFELRPPNLWDKGRAVLWLLERLHLTPRDTCPVCVGDDVTDEDMFAATQGWGVSVVVGNPEHPTRAEYRLADSSQAALFLDKFAAAAQN
jgi:alpha,alpha-trehalase